jgi:hypothetical protein
MEYDLKPILATVERFGASVTFFNIPSDAMFRQAGQDPGIDSRYLELERHLDSVIGGGRHRYLSFYQQVRAEKLPIDSLFFSCDPHLHGRGMNRLARFLRDARDPR